MIDSSYAFVARQAIFDDKLRVHGYELLFRDGEKNCFPDIPPDEATSKILANSHLNHGLDELTGGRKAYINFYEDTLLYRFPTFLDPTKVVIEVLETVPISDELLRACRHIRGLGYQMALDDHDFDPKWDVFLPHVDVIKVDVLENDYETTAANMEKLLKAKVKLIAEKIETREEFERYRDLGFHYFQGYFFARPEVIRKRALPVSKMNLVELISASSSANFDFNRINNIIERDVTLSYKLLRFINNPIFNKRQQISSLRHALNYMGEVELKKFIALMTLANLNDEKPTELLQLSLVRAKFCELLARAKGEDENPPKGFLLGMFSLLDALLDQSMSDVMANLPILEEIKTALCSNEAKLSNYLQLVKSIEQANWQETERLVKALALSDAEVAAFYQEALEWAQSFQGML
ncbi:HDOD domain-containing protein [Aliiglaciecola sp. CAU 1673]|uniref:EAL and HDOD domain-containing protein n=1 Tax=Aliiglaciecola sp. CAU 1673 TaxID=3032595 RepID=UPI0023DB6038|nr:HDOD domain-containing protein [Aliiglaciecola sp. CAU 1673]MDF2177821.1 HDOD domain-containing protein [Aliiglaciecola sp. CAU 1673]